MNARPRVLTIGYERRSLADVVRVLREHGVRTVVDVRERPFSRRPEFERDALARALPRHGLRYVHAPDLGCALPERQALRRGGAFAAYARAYEQRLARHWDALEWLEDLARRERVVLLCTERRVTECHRLVLADVLAGRGFDAEHV